MAGWLTNNVQQVLPIVVNGTTVQAASINFNSTTIGMGNAPPLTQLPSNALLPIDVQASANASGAQPISAAATAFQIASVGLEATANTATSTAGAATLNTTSGFITTEALTTAAGSTYTFTLTNSLITATGPAPYMRLGDKTNTTSGTQLTSITNASGSTVAVFLNTGTAAWNGTRTLSFHI